MSKAPPDGDAHRVLLLTGSAEWAPLSIVCLPGDEPIVRFQSRAAADTSGEWHRSATATKRYGGGALHSRRIAHGLLGGPWCVDICPSRATVVASPFDAAALLRSEGFFGIPLPAANDPAWRTTMVLCVPAGSLYLVGGDKVAAGGRDSARITPPWLFGSSGGTAVAVVLAAQVPESAAPMFALLQAVLQHATDLAVSASP